MSDTCISKYPWMSHLGEELTLGQWSMSVIDAIAGLFQETYDTVNNHVFYVYMFIWANNMSSAIRHHLLGIWGVTEKFTC